jgi:hypothetical protein
MRLFSNHASKSASKSLAAARAAAGQTKKSRLGMLRSTRDSMFEPLENRDLFSFSIVTPIHTVPIYLLPPVAATTAINAEYTHTAAEADAYGANVRSLLGANTTGIVSVPGVSGAYVEKFHDNGAIYWSASTGAHVVFGGIGAEYANLATETDAYGTNVQSIVGLPTSDEISLPGVSGARENTFQGGQIVWSGPTGAHVVFGGIGGLYDGMGGGSSWLGMPTSDETGPLNNRVVHYQDGYISWNPTNGAVAHQTSISFNTRYGDELVITENGLRDSLNLSQSGSTLDVFANGNFVTEAIPAGGVFVYTRGGADSMYIGSSVNARTTVDAIDGAHTNIWAFGGQTIVWDDSGDSYTGSAPQHSVGSFAGGVSKSLGAHLANPSDSGSTFTVNRSLFGTGPVAGDINQGSVGDCYFMASLAGFAQWHTSVILNSAVDLGDGTYAVEFFHSGTPEFIRVNNQFPTGGFAGFHFAYPGANNTIWGCVMEKAFAYFRTGANTYNSINNGWPSEAYSDLNVGSNSFNPGENIFGIMFHPDSSLYSECYNDLTSGKPVTLCTPGSPPNLVGDHCYTLTGVETIGGTHYYIVRNPWGDSGDSLENAQGYATLTYSQLVNNFTNFTEAT